MSDDGISSQEFFALDPELEPEPDAADTADRFSDTADEARWENEGGAVLPLSHRDATAAS